MDEAAVESPEPQNENEKASKNKARVRSGRKSALDFRKYTKQIWLAGLGAFSRAEEEGNKLKNINVLKNISDQRMPFTNP